MNKLTSCRLGEGCKLVGQEGGRKQGKTFLFVKGGVHQEHYCIHVRKQFGVYWKHVWIKYGTCWNHVPSSKCMFGGAMVHVSSFLGEVCKLIKYVFIVSTLHIFLPVQITPKPELFKKKKIYKLKQIWEKIKTHVLKTSKKKNQ